MKQDAHIHTPFCPHGSTDSFEQYIDKAIAHGFTDISFTEHAPLPEGFIDPTPDKDSGMLLTQLEPYLHTVTQLKKQYAQQINISVGLEVDYIIGYEQQTTQFLQTYGAALDDSILSVHFLRHAHHYTCIDFSAEEFMRFSKQIGSVQGVYDLYYETLQQSILADLGAYKPKRIGHPTLVHKFQHAHGEHIDDDASIVQTLQLMAQHGYALDVNSAGLAKQHCLEQYPPKRYVELAKTLHIPLVFGSDAHTAADLHQFYEDVWQ
ncbi:histidinol-phosphatase HisJ [Caryophanon tenue]|uniref:Histidinol-phosphatase n=1 Tax=Caryophanon tenue TaxID=33978 RepID=A0A1C0YMB6_9BACL|nr:histidinol-phosphatase HisJ [Caryophanon tenue]OCS88327.1 histidinol phosphatase [Caryophanon tenue]